MASQRKSACICIVCGIVFAISAVLIILGIAIESSAHNGAGYTIGLLSLIPLGFSAWGIARHYPIWKSDGSAASRPGPVAPSRSRVEPSSSAPGVAMQNVGDDDDNSNENAYSAGAQFAARGAWRPATAHDDDIHAPALSATARRERHMTAKGEEPYIGGLSPLREAPSSDEPSLTTGQEAESAAREPTDKEDALMGDAASAEVGPAEPASREEAYSEGAEPEAPQAEGPEPEQASQAPGAAESRTQKPRVRVNAAGQIIGRDA